MRQRAFFAGAWVTALFAAAAGGVTRASEPCVGDCPPLDSRVTVNELVLGAAIALGGATVDACPSYDVNGNGRVAVDALIAAVNNALNGCPGGPTPVPSATPIGPLPTATPTPAAGPVVSFFGVASADDSLQQPTAKDPSGTIPIYQRPFGFGFQLVVEALPGTSQRSVGESTQNTAGGPPDLQIQATRDLGNGSTAVCDGLSPTFGGVPGIDPPQLGDPDAIENALNDFGCRFIDGTGAVVGRSCSESCVRFTDTDFECVSSQLALQFCALVDTPLRFPAGDTLLTVRVRDVVGTLGAPAQLIVRIAGP